MKSCLAVCTSLALLWCGARPEQLTQPPHIVVIMADDLGWNDVGFHGSNQIPTPNIDALAYSGIILNQHYVQPLCTPSRAAFLTGKYPLHTGMQHSVILEPEPRGLPLQEVLLAARLRSVGYATRAVGKWHLGYHRTEFTPTRRGFDSHYGYWNGFQDYYDHTVTATFQPSMSGYDMRRDLQVEWGARGHYSTRLFGGEAARLVAEHPADRPLFLYLAHLAPHAGNMRAPLQAPDELIARFAHIADPERRIYAAMVAALDESVGQLVAALRARGMLDNCVLLFLSDNGAPTKGIHANHGSNYPLRGQKESPWEGASRGAALLWSPLLKGAPRVSSQLMHVVDWLPTFWSAAGRNPAELGEIDGVSMWEALRDGGPSPRTHLVHNIDLQVPYLAVRRGDWKYINGTTAEGKYDDWLGESGEDVAEYDAEAVLTSEAAKALAGYVAERQIKEKRSTNGSATFGVGPLKKDTVMALRKLATVSCGKERSSGTSCDPRRAPCLFNIEEDPCETDNLAAAHPEILFDLEKLARRYIASGVPASNLPADEAANPVNFNNVWSSWKDDSVQMKSAFEVFSPAANAAFAVFCAVSCLAIVIVGVTLLRRRGCGSARGQAEAEHVLYTAGAPGPRAGRGSLDPRSVSPPPGRVARAIEMFEDKEQTRGRGA